MDAYIIRFNQNLDFYVPFDEPLTAGEVKQEMFLQLEESTSSMFLIYNGEILKDESKLETLGIKNGSILHLYIPKYDNIFVQSPKRMMNEILSLFININLIPDESYIEAVQTIKKYIASPIIKSLVRIVPELNDIFDEILDYIKEIEAPCDESIYETISRIQDNAFVNEHLYDSDLKSYTEFKSEEGAIYETKCQHILDVQDDYFQSEGHTTNIDEPLKVDYIPSISSDPLPFYDPYNFCNSADY